MTFSRRPTVAHLKQTIAERFPVLWVHWHFIRRPRTAEIELEQLRKIVGRGDGTVDVGANFGLYTRRLARLSSRVYAFEPSKPVADILRRTSARNVTIHETALSDRDGEAELRTPLGDVRPAYGLSSLEPDAVAGRNVTVSTVRLARLDSIVQDNVSFVKVDVEGHELNVLQGARGLIEHCRPVFLVEAEERHRVGATASLFDFFRNENYEGFFMRDGDVVGVEAFDTRVDQDETALTSDGGRRPGHHYVNNFFFFPAERKGRAILAAA